MELGLFTKWYNTNKETATTSQNTRTYSIKKKKTSQAFTRISKSNNKKKISGPSVFVSAQIHTRTWLSGVCVWTKWNKHNFLALQHIRDDVIVQRISAFFFFFLSISTNSNLRKHTTFSPLFFVVVTVLLFDGWLIPPFLSTICVFFFLSRQQTSVIESQILPAGVVDDQT